MSETRLPYRISVLFYAIVFIIPLGFYSTYSSFDAIKKDSHVLKQSGWMQGTLPFISGAPFNELTAYRVDSTLQKYAEWSDQNGNSEYYIGTETLQKDVQDAQQCWNHAKAAKSALNTSCAARLQTLSISIQEIVKSKQKKMVNLFYISLSITMLVILYSIYLLRLFIMYQMKKHSIYDFDTYLYNHKYFRGQLKTLVARAKRYDEPFSLLMVSLVGFDKKNYDKKTRERVLLQVGEVFKVVTRASDIICRWDENHIAVLMPYTKIEHAHTLEQRLREIFEKQDFNLKPALAFDFSTTEYNTEESDEGFLKRTKEAL